MTASQRTPQESPTLKKNWNKQKTPNQNNNSSPWVLWGKQPSHFKNLNLPPSSCLTFGQMPTQNPCLFGLWMLSRALFLLALLFLASLSSEKSRGWNVSVNDVWITVNWFKRAHHPTLIIKPLSLHSERELAWCPSRQVHPSLCLLLSVTAVWRARSSPFLKEVGGGLETNYSAKPSCTTGFAKKLFLRVLHSSAALNCPFLRGKSRSAPTYTDQLRCIMLSLTGGELETDINTVLFMRMERKCHSPGKAYETMLCLLFIRTFGLNVIHLSAHPAAEIQLLWTIGELQEEAQLWKHLFLLHSRFPATYPGQIIQILEAMALWSVCAV